MPDDTTHTTENSVKSALRPFESLRDLGGLNRIFMSFYAADDWAGRFYGGYPYPTGNSGINAETALNPPAGGHGTNN